MSLERMAKRVVVAVPNVERVDAWERVLRVRERYDPLVERIAPHLTLVFPFADAMSDSDLEGHLRSVVGQFPAFPITLGDVTAHEGEFLFLNVKQGNDALIHLHDALYTGALAPYRLRLHTFIPHITIGRVATEHLQDALDDAADLTSRIQASVDALSVYRVEADGACPVVAHVPLRAC